MYNEEQNIRHCVSSIEAQTYKDWELLLIDDGSTDRSSSICDSYAEKDSRIRVIHQKNKGFSGSRNTGINAARGEYIMFVDCDDWLEPDALKIGAEKMEERALDLVIGGLNWAVFKGDRMISSTPTAPDADYYFRTAEMAEAGPRLWNVNAYGGCLHYCVWGRLFRMRIIDDYDLRFDEQMCVQEDVKFMYTYLFYSDRCMASKDIFYNYYRPYDKDDIGEKPQVDQYRCVEESLVAFIKTAIKFDYPETYRTQMYYRTYEHFIKLSGKIFMRATGLSEQQQYQHIKCLANSFAFCFFCRTLGKEDPFWESMKKMLAEGDYDGIFSGWRAELEKGVSAPGK